MLDMLGLCSQQKLNREKINAIKNNLGLTSQGINDIHYNYAENFKLNGSHFFTLKWSPNLPNLKESNILINPSRFNSYLEMESVISNVFTDDLSINRIDFCSDIKIPIREIEAKLRIMNKKKSSSFEEGFKLTGLSFGKKNDVIVIYDKAFHLKKERTRDLTRTKDAELGVMTRFEVRKKGVQVPFPKFSDIHKYLEYNPFKSIHIMEFCNPENHKAIAESKAIWAKEQVKAIGFHKFRKIYNDSNNFSKTWGKAFVPSDLNKEILNNYQQNLSDFLNS